MKPRFVAALLFVLIVLAVTEAAERPPNFLIIISDDQRPDTIGALGNSTIRTPGLDHLVRRGTTFTRATCANPHCVPSRAEILTGTTGFRNGVLHANGKFRAGITFWAEAFAAAGYSTWYSGKWMNDGTPKTRGYHHTRGLFSSGGGGGRPLSNPTDHKGAPVTGYTGWTFKDDSGKPEIQKGIGITPDINRLIADAAIEVIKHSANEPFFLHVNFTAPHDPLLLPPHSGARLETLRVPAPGNFLPEHPFDHGNARGRDELLLPFPRTRDAVIRELTAYYLVIEEMDRQIQRLLSALDSAGTGDQTVIVFSSDHGLATGSHGLMGKQNQYEHTIGVPLILAGPGIPTNRISTAQCYLRDLFPTACEMAGITIPSTVTGVSLLTLLQGKAAEIHPVTYGYWQDAQRMIRTDRYKLIAYPKARRWQMFDLLADREERNDLITTNTNRRPEHELALRDLREKLLGWLETEGDPIAEQVRSLPLE